MKGYARGLLFCAGVVLFVVGCTKSQEQPPDYNFYYDDRGGNDHYFEVPVQTGLNWEVTQSWAEHCELCDQRYPNDPTSYCDDSHTGDCCRYSFDFNLPGNLDQGKPVLASADGEVKAVGYMGGWGYSVLLDHGDDICTRYAHLSGDSVEDLDEGDEVCQGMKIGEISNTGSAHGHHLHFQFEDCLTGDSLPMGFDDGNGVPLCTKGLDVFDENLNYDFLELRNELRTSCELSGPVVGEDAIPEVDWVNASCGALSGCPLNLGCGRSVTDNFVNPSTMSNAELPAAKYLWAECALEGDGNGNMRARDHITKAEALKVPMFLFGLMDQCDGSERESFLDVSPSDWFYGVVTCALAHGIVDGNHALFFPNKHANFAEVMKLAVEPAVRGGLIEMVEGGNHFPYISPSHWSHPHAETLYAHGGLQRDPEEFLPDQLADRGDYFVMVASLSPCYCGNVSCGGGCECNQAAYSCQDLHDNDPGTGGAEVDGPEDNQQEDEEEDNSQNADEPLGFDIECFVVRPLDNCDRHRAVFHTECYVTNRRQETMYVGNLHASVMESDASNCYLVEQVLQTGYYSEEVRPGSTKTLMGHFDLSCDHMPEDREVSLTFNLLDRTGGNSIWLHNADTYGVRVYQESFDYCWDSCQDPPVSEPAPCEPSSCSDLGAVCGVTGDGCGGSVNCGNCPREESCQRNQCVADPEPEPEPEETTESEPEQSQEEEPEEEPAQSGGGRCIPKECHFMNFVCGVNDDGCGGQVDCGDTCAQWPTRTCIDGYCRDPRCGGWTCEERGKECGLMSDGCGGFIHCGSCPENHSCTRSQCVPR